MNYALRTEALLAMDLLKERRGEELPKGVEKKGEIYREESSRRELSTAVEIPLKGPIGPRR